MITATVIEGNILKSTVTITDDATGQNIDPGALAFVYILNSDPTTKITLTYVSATNPIPGIVAKLGVGSYQAQVDLTSLSGTLERYWQSTGAGQGVSPADTIIIPPLPF